MIRKVQMDNAAIQKEMVSGVAIVEEAVVAVADAVGDDTEVDTMAMDAVRIAAKVKTPPTYPVAKLVLLKVIYR